MYSQKQASLVRQKFWTRFGLYMQPVPSAGGEKVNWLNYKTGTREVRIKTDADNNEATVFIEFRGTAVPKFKALEDDFVTVAGDGWEIVEISDEELRAEKKLIAVNIFRESDWPAVIAFLKEGLIGIDEFWSRNNDIFSLG